MLTESGYLGLSEEKLLIAVANTGHREPDEFADAAGIRAWWHELTGLADTAAADPQTVPMLRELRGLIRGAALHNNGVQTEPAAPALLRLDLRLDGRTGSSLRAPGGGLGQEICAAGITALLRASARPSWPRFKACRGEDCRWVYLDASRNCSRRWCDMAACGNRAKSLSFRRRHANPGG